MYFLHDTIRFRLFCTINFIKYLSNDTLKVHNISKISQVEVFDYLLITPYKTIHYNRLQNKNDCNRLTIDYTTFQISNISNLIHAMLSQL